VELVKRSEGRGAHRGNLCRRGWAPRPPMSQRLHTCPAVLPQIEYGGECHISGRPYTKFRWRPGSDARYKSTIICQEVAKAKNVCQVSFSSCLPARAPASFMRLIPGCSRRHELLLTSLH